jgi:hypothetical protein
VLLVEVMTALAVAILLTAILAATLPVRRLWRGWLLFFGVVLLSAWAGGVWLPPVGPSVFGIAWMPFLFVGLVIGLLLAPSTRRRARAAQERVRGEAKVPVETTFSVLIWVLMIGLALAVLLAYV